MSYVENYWQDMDMLIETGDYWVENVVDKFGLFLELEELHAEQPLPPLPDTKEGDVRWVIGIWGAESATELREGWLAACDHEIITLTCDDNPALPTPLTFIGFTDWGELVVAYDAIVWGDFGVVCINGHRAYTGELSGLI